MKNLNNNKLIIILAGLVVVFVLARVFRSPKLSRNLPESIVAVDTATADVIRITPSGETEPVVLQRKDKRWFLKQGDAEQLAEQASVRAMLGQLVKMRPQRMVTRNAAKWGAYQVGDTTTLVVVLKGEEELASVRIGRTAFSQSPGADPQNPFGGGMGSAFTYVRKEGTDEVYTVEGFLEPSFNRKADTWLPRPVVVPDSTAVGGVRP
ncbi:MAG: DUF4340 domain-containing protein [Bacteroidota bacterium]